MKSKDLFCASHASTAICSSMDQRRIVRPKSRTPVAATCFSQIPFDPIPKTSSPKHYLSDNTSPINIGHSSRNLLTKSPFLEHVLSDHSTNNVRALVPYQPPEINLAAAVIPPPTPHHQSPVLCNRTSLAHHLDQSKVKSFPSSSTHHSNRHEHLKVVELRVSIHCKGCEGKVRKHLSKMEGVTSFSIDLDSKKVTVIGNVTPLGVLANISKVKNAQFWPSPAP